ncbi:hypothetical protein GLOIN_2v921480 [Rhizophagus irregularis DAOM 181602=DAOM 197198]|nr:hypothetical protein GLOIN_2v921480 [Rhizophagus irregularis DAOM 181602=DAOM 197198]
MRPTKPEKTQANVSNKTRTLIPSECFRNILETDMRFYRGAIERKEDPRKYYKFLTDHDRLIGEEVLRRGILESRLSTTWLNDLMKEWKKYIQNFAQD